MPKMKKGHVLVRSHSVEGSCRVVGCRQYGKTMKCINRHLKSAHQLSREEHQRLPTCRAKTVQEEAAKQSYMKYRHSERCLIFNCLKYGEYFKVLTKHLKTAHGFTRSQYSEYRSRSEQIEAEQERKRDTYLTYLSEEGGCPATRDERCKIQTEEQLKDVTTFPRYIYYRILTESSRAIIISNTVNFYKLPDEEPHRMTYHIKKYIVSLSHESWFRESIEDSTATITRGRAPKDFQYECGICPFQHSIKLIATPSLIRV